MIEPHQYLAKTALAAFHSLSYTRAYFTGGAGPSGETSLNGPPVEREFSCPAED